MANESEDSQKVAATKSLPGPTAADLLGRGRDLGDRSRRLSAVGCCNRHRGFDDIGPGTQNETDQICAGWKPGRTAPRTGRKLTEVSDPEIEPALQLMLSEEIAGDPMSLQRWVRSSTRNLSARLIEQGHQVGYRTVGRLLRKMGYSLQAAKRRQAGAEHPLVTNSSGASRN